MVWLLVGIIIFCMIIGFILVMACVRSARMTEEHTGRDVYRDPI